VEVTMHNLEGILSLKEEDFMKAVNELPACTA